jgi:hypothetical protein
MGENEEKSSGLERQFDHVNILVKKPFGNPFNTRLLTALLFS